MSDEPVPELTAPPIDWDAIANRLDELFTSDCNAYATACAVLFGEVTEERLKLFKMVFRRVFKLRAPAMLAANFDYTQRLQDAVRASGLHTEIHRAITAGLVGTADHTEE